MSAHLSRRLASQASLSTPAQARTGLLRFLGLLRSIRIHPERFDISNTDCWRFYRTLTRLISFQITLQCFQQSLLSAVFPIQVVQYRLIERICG